MKIGKLVLGCGVLLAAVAVFGQSAPVKVGWGIESIDPGRSSVMPGYGSFRYSYGCADPIYATCLVLDNGKVINCVMVGPTPAKKEWEVLTRTYRAERPVKKAVFVVCFRKRAGKVAVRPLPRHSRACNRRRWRWGTC